MPSLFTFNDAYISAVTGGDSDEDVLDLFAEALSEMGNELDESLPADMEPEWDEDGFYVALTQEQLDEEFGTDEQPALATVRRAFVKSAIPAQRAFEEVLHG